MDAGQGWHGADAAAVEENVPMGHVTQVALLFAPSAEEYLRSAGLQLDLVNDEARCRGTHVPVLQGMHTDAVDALEVVE